MQFELARRVLPDVNQVDDAVMRRRASAHDVFDTERLNARISPAGAGEFSGDGVGDGGRLIVSSLMRGSIQGAVDAQDKPASAAGATTDERERIKALERENRELRQANEILRKASAYFAQAELDRRFKP